MVFFASDFRDAACRLLSCANALPNLILNMGYTSCFQKGNKRSKYSRYTAVITYSDVGTQDGLNN